MSRYFNAAMDTWIITKRNLLRYLRLPQLLIFSSVQPVMFLLLFNYVFGGALGGSTMVPGGKYINYLLPGILMQVVMFGGIQTGIGLADDMNKGIIDRFRSLPMSRLAVIAGRTFGDMLRNLSVVAIMLSVGYAIGFRFQDGFWGAAGMIGIVLLFGYALSWAFGFIGLTLREVESTQVAGFVFIFPLIFASSAFVSVQTMPDWLQTFVKHQPITHVVNTARHFALGIPEINGSIGKSLLWSLAILAIFVPLSLWQYRRRAA